MRTQHINFVNVQQPCRIDLYSYLTSCDVAPIQIQMVNSTYMSEAAQVYTWSSHTPAHQTDLNRSITRPSAGSADANDTITHRICRAYLSTYSSSPSLSKKVLYRYSKVTLDDLAPIRHVLY
eukprot:scaffold6026_cov127-Skeletonema_dohrnii-CCMP3373.AAC.2